MTGDNQPEDNVNTTNDIVVGPIDPNDKINLQGDKMTISQIQSGTWINYVIRFQNVGTASAFNVVVKDTLSSKLQSTTLETIVASHPFKMERKGNITTWWFNNINLPDSTSNPAGSHGFVLFRLKPIETLLVGDSVLNKAAIYFDYNDAVITDTCIIRIQNNNIITAVGNISQTDATILVYPNPLQGCLLHIESKANNQYLRSWRLLSITGSEISKGFISGNRQQAELLLDGISVTGIYILELQTNKHPVYKRILLFK